VVVGLELQQDMVVQLREQLKCALRVLRSEFEYEFESEFEYELNGGPGQVILEVKQDTLSFHIL
jgi:hypothetical protein